jgi:hypothetical protein
MEMPKPIAAAANRVYFFVRGERQVANVWVICRGTKGPAGRTMRRLLTLSLGLPVLSLMAKRLARSKTA